MRAVDIVAAHARLGTPDVVIRERQALYRLAARESGIVPGSVDLDSPVLRAAAGRMLGGGARISAGECRPLSELGAREKFSAVSFTLASTSAAAEHLAPTLALIQGHLRGGAGLRLLVADNARFATVERLIREGTRLALEIDSDLVLDLLAHVELVAVVASGSADRLGSASARECPGLIVLPEPSSAMEVAEALVHEGAHQKLFDLAITHDVIGVATGLAPTYRPSWSPVGTSWPLEQVFAGWHAYSCLARLATAIDGDGRTTSAVPAGSLLRSSDVRAAELLSQLRLSGAYLGRDAHILIEAVSGVALDIERWARQSRLSFDSFSCDVHIEHIAGSNRRLALVSGSPPRLFWLQSETTLGAPTAS